ncbi:hypothetical protein HFZ78_01805 [Priestia megaterium]|uniref:Uncharacterized protein n=1 Tax=Priestia megaterium TaxID=1404 RepID=A0A6H1NWM4_PRIMG|nr:hypothetical protein [Priestia megaterium]QIZ05632.1 hypothetical protein HFZ78_01805 [Priestia megaterium]
MDIRYIKEGLTVYYYDMGKETRTLAIVIEKGYHLEHGHTHPYVVIEDHEDRIHRIVAPESLRLIPKNMNSNRVTNCYSCQAILNNLLMQECIKCGRIICRKCRKCHCGTRWE